MRRIIILYVYFFIYDTADFILRGVDIFYFLVLIQEKFYKSKNV